MDTTTIDSVLVSVIIPTFNSENTIKRALLAVFKQTHKNWELIIIDDCSTDKTVEVCESIFSSMSCNSLIIKSSQNRGPAASRNIGIDAARGEWIAMLDSDDSWRENRISSLLSQADAASADVICDNITLFDAEFSREIGKMFLELPESLRVADLGCGPIKHLALWRACDSPF